MKLFASILCVLIIFIIDFSIKKANRTSHKSENPNEICNGLRNLALQMSLKDMEGINPVGTHGVFGVLMETGHSMATVTLSTFITGDASLYFSSGGGIIGGGGYDQVRRAVVNFNEIADRYISNCQKTTFSPTPMEGQTIFYILTREGIYTYQAKEGDLGNERNALSPLFFKGQEVITQFRLATENKK